MWQTKQSKGIVVQHHGSLKRLGRGVRGQDQKKKQTPERKRKREKTVQPWQNTNKTEKSTGNQFFLYPTIRIFIVINSLWPRRRFMLPLRLGHTNSIGIRHSRIGTVIFFFHD